MKKLSFWSIVLASFLISAGVNAADSAPPTYEVVNGYKQFAELPETPVPLYFPMEKIVVNFQGEGRARFLAIDIKFMSYYPEITGENGEMKWLWPILKNDIDRLLRNQTYSKLSTPNGPDELRADILKASRDVLEKFKVKSELLLDVYLTRFVMQ